jgi:hypothetical protein
MNSGAFFSDAEFGAEAFMTAAVGEIVQLSL